MFPVYRALLIIFCSFITAIAPPAWGADGPENTGTLVLSLPSGSDQSIDAQLQIDRNVLRSTFGEQAQPQSVMDLTRLSVDGRPCTAASPSIISSENVVNVAVRFQCTGTSNWLMISLDSDRDLPAGFTLGVRTPFDHFVLSRDERMSVETITSGTLLFYRAGMDYFTGGLALEHARVGRAHALYYGGLSALPPGVWLLLLTLAVWCSSFSTRVKALLTGGSLLITSGIAAIVLEYQASLSLIPVRPLGFLYLVLIGATGLSGLLPKANARRSLQLALLTLTAVASGLEHAVILRWLEGQQQMSATGLTLAFFLGCAAMITTIGGAAYAAFFAARKIIGPRSDHEKARTVSAAVLLILLAAYPAISMALKIM